MPQFFNCPHCAGSTYVADEFAGSRGLCVHCGREVAVPAFTPSPYAPRPRPASFRRWGLSQHQIKVLGGVLACLAAIAVCAGIVVTTIPIWQRARLNSQRRQSLLKLEQIGAALRAYELDHGRLPPAYVVDNSGKPMYSWRVLILPYLGEDAKRLHQNLKLNEPWDSWQNRAIAANMPDVFASPLDPAAVTASESSYKVIIGANTLFPPPPDERKFSEITDDPHGTLLVVETSSTAGTFWTEPVELDAKKMTFAVADGSPMELGGSDPLGAHVLFADGSTGILPIGVAPPIVRTMSTIDQGEPEFPEMIIREDE